jgi:hypothetical protein
VVTSYSLAIYGSNSSKNRDHLLTFFARYFAFLSMISESNIFLDPQYWCTSFSTQIFSFPFRKCLSSIPSPLLIHHSFCPYFLFLFRFLFLFIPPSPQVSHSRSSPLPTLLSFCTSLLFIFFRYSWPRL